MIDLFELSLYGGTYPPPVLLGGGYDGEGENPGFWAGGGWSSA